MTEADAAHLVEATEPSRSPSIAELERNVEQTRDELAATVAALTAKANLLARARERFGRMGMRRQDRTPGGAYIAREGGRNNTSGGMSFLRQSSWVAAAVAAAAIVGWLLIRRRHR